MVTTFKTMVLSVRLEITQAKKKKKGNSKRAHTAHEEDWESKAFGEWECNLMRRLRSRVAEERRRDVTRRQAEEIARRTAGIVQAQTEKFGYVPP